MGKTKIAVTFSFFDSSSFIFGAIYLSGSFLSGIKSMTTNLAIICSDSGISAQHCPNTLSQISMVKHRSEGDNLQIEGENRLT